MSMFDPFSIDFAVFNDGCYITSKISFQVSISSSALEVSPEIRLLYRLVHSNNNEYKLDFILWRVKKEMY